MGVETNTYDIGSLDDIGSIRDNKGCTFFAVYVAQAVVEWNGEELGEEPVLYQERLHSRRLSSTEVFDEYIEISKIVAKELDSRGIPRKQTKLYITNQGSELPEYLQHMYRSAELV